MPRYCVTKFAKLIRSALKLLLLGLPAAAYTLAAHAVPPKDPLAQEAPKASTEDTRIEPPMPPETQLLGQCRLPMPKAPSKAVRVRVVLNPEEREEHTYINQSWGRIGAEQEGFLTTLQTLTVQDRFFRDKDGLLQADIESIDSQLVGTLPQPILDLIAQLDLDGERSRLAFDKNGVPRALINSEKVASTMRAKAETVRQQMDMLFRLAELSPEEQAALNGLVDSVWLESARKVTAQRANEGLVNGNLDYFITSGRSFALGVADKVVLNRVGDVPVQATVWPIQLDKETLTVCFKYDVTYTQNPEPDTAEDGVTRGTLPQTRTQEAEMPNKAEPVKGEVLGGVLVRLSDGLPTRVEREEKTRNKDILYELISVSALQISL
jgi:hypothetical protein